MTFIFLEMVEYIDNSDHGKYHLLTCLPPDTIQVTSLFGKKLSDEIYYNPESGLLYRPNTTKRTKQDFPYQTITGDRIMLFGSRYSVYRVLKELKSRRY